MSLLEVRNVTQRFGELAAVKNVSLSVEEGELHAIIGPNGAGKTTLFNMISGFYVPTAGHITFGGADVTAMPTHERVGMGMARTFQITEVFPELTVRENLRIAVQVTDGLRLKMFNTRRQVAATEGRVDELLEAGALTANAGRHVGELSHGDQRSAEIMMALATRPKLLLLDEPAAGMGSQETYDTAVLIRRLHRKQKLTIVLVEHDMRVIFNLADRITVLSEGEMLDQGTPDEIAASEKVQVAYLGEKREGS
ncbi:MAG: ABC transporter ATP-binding protein [Burkholderiaceae bacterium]|nr:ABC transporter ATP-binding protein [Burkholderiales bacterium]TAL73823.1 MAG: ABC transporter ATP-binding protein [Burkholderiaceae bacterium]TBR76058.1 MAG: ABC transporter ATP-binding protein [Burkholderiaceae bacterium]